MASREASQMEMKMNDRGIKFINDRTAPLAVDTMKCAAEIILKEIEKREERIATGRELETDRTEAFGMHIAWVIGFDALIDDRKAIHHVTEKIVID
jgi:hypothetical protein